MLPVSDISRHVATDGMAIIPLRIGQSSTGGGAYEPVFNG